MSDNLHARRAAFMESAGEAFDRMFDANEQHQLITFTQREDRMLELGKKLQIELLQAHLQADPPALFFPLRTARWDSAVKATVPCCCGRS